MLMDSPDLLPQQVEVLHVAAISFSLAMAR